MTIVAVMNIVSAHQSIQLIPFTLIVEIKKPLDNNFVRFGHDDLLAILVALYYLQKVVARLPKVSLHSTRQESDRRSPFSEATIAPVQRQQLFQSSSHIVPRTIGCEAFLSKVPSAHPWVGPAPAGAWRPPPLRRHGAGQGKDDPRAGS